MFWFKFMKHFTWKCISYLLWHSGFWSVGNPESQDLLILNAKASLSKSLGTVLVYVFIGHLNKYHKLIMTFTLGVSENQRNYSMNLYWWFLHNFTGASLPYACSMAIYARINRFFATSSVQKSGVRLLLSNAIKFIKKRQRQKVTKGFCFK